MEYKINQFERSALKGLPYLARLIYLEALRPYMDYQTGIVGIKRGISYQSIREELYIEPHPGYKSGSPSKQQIQRALKQLEKVGLISFLSTDKKLVVMCEKASTDSHVQKQAGTKPIHQAGTKSIAASPLNSGIVAFSNQQADTPKTAQADTPPVTGNNKHSLYVRNKKIHFNFEPKNETVAKAINLGFINAANQDELLKFISYHQGKGTTAQDWDAMFLHWCLRGKSFQQQGDNKHAQKHRSPKPQTRSQGFSSAVDRVLQANKENLVIETNSEEYAYS